ncbi:hypothetical protein HDU67_007706 [Dinochytrium kinnereticum]|nr:hypothetical protein HDU67_007706 [Dinochytrium kinnereticum]
MASDGYQGKVASKSPPAGNGTYPRMTDGGSGSQQHQWTHHDDRSNYDHRQSQQHSALPPHPNAYSGAQSGQASPYGAHHAPTGTYAQSRSVPVSSPPAGRFDGRHHGEGLAGSGQEGSGRGSPVDGGGMQHGIPWTALTIAVPSGIQLRAKVWGRAASDESGGSARILAVHGWLDNANSWDLIAPRLANDHNAHVVCIDLPGHGHSDHRHTQGGYYLWDMVDDLLGVVDHLKWPTFTLLGHSTGGHIAAAFAGVYPNRVRAIAMIESIGTSIQFTAEEPVEMAGFIQRRRELNRGPRRTRVYTSFEDAAAARTNGFTKVSLEAARLLCQRGLEPVDDAGGVGIVADGRQQRYRWRTDPRLTLWAFLHCPEVTIQSLFKAITAPVLIVAASQSEIFSLDAKRWAARLASFSTLRKATLPGNHHLHLERESVEAVVGLLTDFLGWESATSADQAVSALCCRGVRLGPEMGSPVITLASLAAVVGAHRTVSPDAAVASDSATGEAVNGAGLSASSRSAAAALCSISMQPSPTATPRAPPPPPSQATPGKPVKEPAAQLAPHSTAPSGWEGSPNAPSTSSSSSSSISSVANFSPYSKSPESGLDALSAAADHVARSSMSPSVQNSPSLEAGAPLRNSAAMVASAQPLKIRSPSPVTCSTRPREAENGEETSQKRVKVDKEPSTRKRLERPHKSDSARVMMMNATIASMGKRALLVGLDVGAAQSAAAAVAAIGGIRQRRRSFSGVTKRGESPGGGSNYSASPVSTSSPILAGGVVVGGDVGRGEGEGDVLMGENGIGGTVEARAVTSK